MKPTKTETIVILKHPTFLYIYATLYILSISLLSHHQYITSITFFYLLLSPSRDQLDISVSTKHFPKVNLSRQTLKKVNP